MLRAVLGAIKVTGVLHLPALVDAPPPQCNSAAGRDRLSIKLGSGLAVRDPVGSKNPIATGGRLPRSDLGQCRAVIRSLLYLLLRRVLGAFRSDERAAAQAELEIAVLRHQIVVLRRQVKRPIYRASDKAFLAPRAGRFGGRRGMRSWSAQRRSCGGTGNSSSGSGPGHAALLDAPPWIPRSES
jgi:hypothetical protein